MRQTIRQVLFFVGCSLCAAFTPEQEKAMQVMAKYCSACHAIEPQRFIVSEDPRVNWDHIHSRGPTPTKTWAQAIVPLLDWPSADPKELKDPPAPNPRWMPVGHRRYTMSQEMIDHRNARQFMLEIVGGLE